MIDAIINSLEDFFRGEDMDWIDKYGGLTETWTREIKGQNDITILEAVPVARGTGQNCGEPCLYHLAPDPARKKNVVFWTLITDAVPSSPTNISRALKAIQYTQTVRLNVWLNFSECKECNSGTYLAYTQYLTAALHGRRFSLAEPIGLSGTMKLAGVPNKDYKEVFGQWTWGQEQRLFVHPFDFFGLDITFTWIQNQSCKVVPSC